MDGFIFLIFLVWKWQSYEPNKREHWNCWSAPLKDSRPHFVITWPTWFRADLNGAASCQSHQGDWTQKSNRTETWTYSCCVEKKRTTVIMSFPPSFSNSSPLSSGTWTKTCTRLAVTSGQNETDLFQYHTQPWHDLCRERVHCHSRGWREENVSWL